MLTITTYLNSTNRLVHQKTESSVIGKPCWYTNVRPEPFFQCQSNSER